MGITWAAHRRSGVPRWAWSFGDHNKRSPLVITCRTARAVGPTLLVGNSGAEMTFGPVCAVSGGRRLQERCMGDASSGT